MISKRQEYGKTQTGKKVMERHYKRKTERQMEKEKANWTDRLRQNVETKKSWTSRRTEYGETRGRQSERQTDIFFLRAWP